MKRIIDHTLRKWQTSKNRKPLLLWGTRQVGKTYSLREFGRNCFPKYHFINFEEQPSATSIFAHDLTPELIIRDMSIFLDTPVDTRNDLLIFDEIQTCPRALTSLKYFAEKMPDMAVCAAGSLLGVHLAECSFPVGKIDERHMYPMTFAEFLMNADNSLLYDAFQSINSLTPISETLHSRLWDTFKNYLVTGGLPEVVATFYQEQGDLFSAFQKVRNLQNRRITDYVADMAKHCGKQNAMHIERLWRSSVPCSVPAI